MHTSLLYRHTRHLQPTLLLIIIGLKQRTLNKVCRSTVKMFYKNKDLLQLQNRVASCCGHSTHVFVANHLHIATAAPRPPPAVVSGENNNYYCTFSSNECCNYMHDECCKSKHFLVGKQSAKIPVLKDPVVYSRTGVCTVAYHQHGMVEV